MKLYRFEKNKETRLNTIKNGEIRLSPPTEFNDLADSLLESVWLTTMDENTRITLLESFEAIRKSAPSHLFPFPQETQVSVMNLLLYCDQAGKPGKRFENENREKKREHVKKVSDYIRSTSGICCFFGGKPTHPLMWAHYADSHKGFCVEYEVDKTNLQELFEVNYTTKPEAPSIEELLFCPHQVIGRILMRKGHEWSYEKEYRLIYINEFNPGDNGKVKPLPEGFRACRLIKGDRIKDPTKIDELAQALNIPVVSYENFTNS